MAQPSSGKGKDCVGRSAISEPSNSRSQILLGNVSGLIDRTGVGDTVFRMTSNISSKKVSAAAARRERQAQLKAHRTVVPLPTDCVDYLESYRPDDVSDEVWGLLHRCSPM